MKSVNDMIEKERKKEADRRDKDMALYQRSYDALVKRLSDVDLNAVPLQFKTPEVHEAHDNPGSVYATIAGEKLVVMCLAKEYRFTLGSEGALGLSNIQLSISKMRRRPATLDEACKHIAEWVGKALVIESKQNPEEKE